MVGGGLVINLLAQDMGASPFLLGMLGFSWGLSFAVGCPVVGRWADRHDRRILLLAGGSLFTATIWLYQWCQNPWHLFALNFLAGTACALFWPVFETLLHDASSASRTQERMGLFNIGWTCGVATGTAAGGFLKEWGTHPALNFLAVLSFLNLLYLAWRIRDLPSPTAPAEEPSPAPHQDVPAPRRIGYLYIAWIANFSLFFTGGATSQMFPKLARELAFPDGDIGLLLALITVAQGISFLILTRTTRWHYRMAPLLAFQALSVVGVGCLIAAHGPAGFAVGLVCIGLGRGMSYTASLYYALSAGSERGAQIGLHEMLIGAAFVLGPFLGGLAAQIQGHWLPLTVALRAPFELAAVVTLGGIGAEYWLWRKMLRQGR